MKIPELTEETVVRYACYGSFFTCAVALVVALATDSGAWPGFLVGVFLFGAASAWLHRAEMERRENQRNRDAANSHGGHYVVMDADDPDGV